MRAPFRLLAAVLLPAAVLAAPPAPPRAVEPLPQAVVPFPYVPPSYCWVAVRLYDTLRDGPVDFCREKLRYTPGRLECYQFLDQVCATVAPSGQWIESRNPVQRSVFQCPPGPEPPVCRRLEIR